MAHWAYVGLLLLFLLSVTLTFAEDTDEEGSSTRRASRRAGRRKKVGRNRATSSTEAATSLNNATEVPDVIVPTEEEIAGVGEQARETVDGCSVCNLEACPPTPSDAPSGLVLDECNCCLIEGNSEGNRCYNSTLNLPYSADVGLCGPGLVCRLRNDLDSTDVLEALCECRDSRMVCGNDNRTYTSECRLREVAHSKPDLIVHTWKPCNTAPWIPTPVENVTAAVGADVSISCEVHGYPNSVIHWEFQPEDSALSTVLPGDDSSVVVVVRGGPEPLMSTSWLQIISISPKFQGLLRCIAVNAEGRTQGQALLSVYRPPEGRSDGVSPAPSH